MTGETYSVSELTDIIKNILGREEILQFVQVSGEISNYKVYTSGHAYFTLKDAYSNLKCVCFRSNMMRGVRFKPENGMQILALGRVDVYPRDGVYQLYVERMLPAGQGDLMQILAVLKAQLEQEGLFDPAKKRALPLLPKAVGVITSPNGAAVRDIIKVSRERYSGVKIYLAPVRVQGLASEQEILRAFDILEQSELVDVIILGRGGGSQEDLWVFNSEAITRRIFTCQLPVVSAVGHETDDTLADYAADVRAATPSQGAELVVPRCEELLAQISRWQQLVAGALQRQLRERTYELELLGKAHVLNQPELWLQRFWLSLQRLKDSLTFGQQRLLEKSIRRWELLNADLKGHNPLDLLSRGFIGARYQGKSLYSIDQVRQGDVLSLELADGILQAGVLEKIPRNKEKDSGQTQS